jgi:glucose/arabinose dehydrogenase
MWFSRRIRRAFSPPPNRSWNRSLFGDDRPEAQLSALLPEAVATFEKAAAAEDFDTAAVIVGEGVGRIRDVRPAADIVHEMVRDATRILT